MPQVKSRSRFRWHTLLIVALIVGLLWYSFRDVHPAEVWRHILGANLWLLLAAMVATLQTYLFRAHRWQLILAPIGHARFRTTLRATFIGFTATFLLPGRVGELLRAYLVAKQDGFKMTATFATVIIERLFDLSTTLLLFACSLPFVSVPVEPWIKIAAAATAAAALVCLVTAYFFAGNPAGLSRLAGRLTRRLPVRIGAAITNFVHTFAEGLAVMRSPGRLLVIFLWSIPLWTSITLGVYLASRAFDITFPFMDAFLVMMFLVVGVSAPTPGGVGPFEFAYIEAVRLFGANQDAAAAASIVLHLVSFVPVTLFGLVFMWQDGLTLGGLKDMGNEAKEAEES